MENQALQEKPKIDLIHDALSELDVEFRIIPNQLDDSEPERYLIIIDHV